MFSPLLSYFGLITCRFLLKDGQLWLCEPQAKLVSNLLSDVFCWCVCKECFKIQLLALYFITKLSFYFAHTYLLPPWYEEMGEIGETCDYL